MERAMTDYKPKPGELVRYTGGFLKSVGMHFDGPINGMVTSTSGKFARVRWNDREEDVTVGAFNLEQCPKDKEITDSFRICLMKEFGADGVVPYTAEEMG
jgi:hypothetical protein